MGRKPKNRAARVKSMDALLAQNRRDSEAPHVGKIKFEVREHTEPANANEDPRGWLFSGRPPAPDDDPEFESSSEDIRNARFRVQDDADASGGEDPRGWLFSGRPEALEPPADPPSIPARVAKLDLVKKLKERRRSGEQRAVRAQDEAPAVQARTKARAPRKPPAAAERKPQQAASGAAKAPLVPQTEIAAVEIAAVAEGSKSRDRAHQKSDDSDPTLRVATPSADDDELKPSTSALDLDLETPALVVRQKTKRSFSLLLSLLFLVGALASGWYLFASGVFEDLIATEKSRTTTTSKPSRRVVAFAKRTASQKSSEQAATAEQSPTTEQTPTVPQEQVVTEIAPLTRQQQALSDDERAKEARYLRARGFRAIRQEKLDKAEESFRESLQLYPSSSVSLRGLGKTLSLKGETDRARAWLERALRRNPADKEVQALLDKLQEG